MLVAVSLAQPVHSCRAPVSVQWKCSSHVTERGAPNSPMHSPCRGPEVPYKQQASASSTCCSFSVTQADAALLLALHQHLL